MYALIDADRIPYLIGSFTNDEGYPLEWPLVVDRVDTNIQNILQGCGATTGLLYLTADDKSNFRIPAATIRPYKGNRLTEKYFWYEQIRRYLVDRYDACVVSGMEADDAIGIECCTDTFPYVICSVDKDLEMIPGNHYNELHPEKGVYYIDERVAIQNFYCQLLVGDSTDNIPGLYRVGPSSSYVRNIRGLHSEHDMYKVCRGLYQSYFGSYWKQFLWENAKLLWILRSNNVNEIDERLSSLEADSKIESESNLKTME